jgi:hypothetical protein
MKAIARTLLLVTLVATMPCSSWAHSGGLNSEGCHNNRKTGEYHCHGSPAPDKANGTVKKSTSGICHGPSSPYYAQTKNFTAYSSIGECLDSGGRLPR